MHTFYCHHISEGSGILRTHAILTSALSPAVCGSEVVWTSVVFSDDDSQQYWPSQRNLGGPPELQTLESPVCHSQDHHKAHKTNQNFCWHLGTVLSCVEQACKMTANL